MIEAIYLPITGKKYSFDTGRQLTDNERELFRAIADLLDITIELMKNANNLEMKRILKTAMDCMAAPSAQ